MYHMIPAYEFRRRARMAMKPVMPILLVVALIAALPSLINSAVTLITDADPNVLLTDYSNRVMQVVEQNGLMQNEVMGEIVIDEAKLTEDLYTALTEYLVSSENFLREKGPIIAALSLMVAVCSPVLTLGLINAMLHALRKQPFGPEIALSRVKYILKALGLMLIFALKLLLWMLPGFALIIGGVFLPEGAGVAVMIVGMIAAIVMGIMASYRYAMVTYVMADDPTTTIRGCFRRSCEVMKRRKLELFSLEISFIGWRLLLSMVQSLLLGFGAVIGMTLGMFASLFLTVYTNCAQAAFYQEYAVGPVEEPAQEAENDGLND